MVLENLSNTIKIALLATVALACALLAFAGVTPETGFGFLKHLGPHFLAALLLVFLATAFACYRPMRDKFVRPSNLGLVLLLLAALFVTTQEDPRFKVLQDDVVLSATALNIHLNRIQELPMGGHIVGGYYQLSDGYLDKRAALYSTILALTHDLTGYRIENAFYLNQFLTVILIMLLFELVRRLTRVELLGVLAVLLFATTPVVVNNATGGGFEILNLVLILVLLHAGLTYWQSADQKSLLLLCLSAVLLSYVRYESVFFVGMTAILIGIRWWQDKDIALPWQLLFIPAAMIPAVFQLNVSFHNEALWQLEDYTTPFSTSYVAANFGAAVAYLGSIAGEKSNSPILFYLGVPALVLVLYRLGSKAGQSIRGSQPGFVILLVAVTVLAQCLLVLHFFSGNLNMASATRYVLPLYLLLTIAICLALAEFTKHRAVIASIGLFLAINAWTFTLPAMAQQKYTHGYLFEIRDHWVLDFYNSQSGGRHLLIHPRPWRFILHQIPVTQLQVVKSAPWELGFHMENRTFDNVYIVQEYIQLGSGIQWLFGSDVSDRFVLEEQSTFSYAPFQFVRISKVLEVRKGDPVSTSGEKNPEEGEAGPSQGADAAPRLIRQQIDPELMKLWHQFLP